MYLTRKWSEIMGTKDERLEARECQSARASARIPWDYVVLFAVSCGVGPVLRVHRARISLTLARMSSGKSRYLMPMSFVSRLCMKAKQAK